MINKRFEIKFVVNSNQLGLVQQHILRNPYSFSQAFEDRMVNNIYYDTPDGVTLHQNLNGDNVRTKYRIRWYNDNYLDAILELKYKENLLGWKSFIPIHKNLDFTNSNTLTLSNQPFINNLGLIKSMQNTYLRSYFISLDGRFRFTIDRDIKNIDLHNPRLLLSNDSKIVIELKFDQVDYKGAQDVLSFFPYRQVKNSKFVSGVNAQNR